MKYSFTSLALAGLASAAAVNTNASPVSVSLTSMGDTTVKAVVTNNGDQGYNIMHKGTILDSFPVDKFKITKDASKANFYGIKLRMGTTGFHEDDFTALAPGESKEVVVNLAELYGLDKSGVYDVTASGRFRVADINSTEIIRGAGIQYSSNSLSVDVDGQKASKITEAMRAQKAGRASLASRSKIDSGCTAKQTATIKDGIRRCVSQANAAADAAVNGSSSKFKEYFMSTAAKDRKYVASRFKAVAKECDATNGGVLTVHCDDVDSYCRSNDFAYTDPDTDIVVWCSQYWAADLETSQCHGDDKTGTTIHEYTHAGDVFSPGTGDHAYGYDACVELSRAEALENADTYEYYANAIHLGC